MIDADEVVILVDETDRELGTMPKLAAHLEGRLHRAISVIIVNGAGEMLLQQRARSKYHSGGLWTNACCSHPRPGETTQASAARRLKEEMGIEAQLVPMFTTMYRAELGSLIEHELVHVFGGRFDGTVSADPAEVDGYEWRSLDWLAEDVAAHPQRYTAWFIKYIREYRPHMAALSANV
jgi:isopentenyl-diphosphate delta-isomerase